MKEDPEKITPPIKCRFFLTYAHDDNETGNFDWVVQELEQQGVNVQYDEVILIAGKKLWPQIETSILDTELDGWGILLTANSLNSLACMEELEYARLRALNEHGKEFPLIGLVDRVPGNAVPLAIRARLYVDLTDRNWVEKVKAGLERRPPTKPPGGVSKYRWSVRRKYGGDPELIAVEVGPRFGSIPYFGLISPMPGPEKAGVGVADGGAVSGTQSDVQEASNIDFQGEKCWAYWMKGPLDPSMSAYALFRGYLPRWVVLGPCKGPGLFPEKAERIRL